VILMIAVLVLFTAALRAESKVKVWGMRGTAWKQCSDTEKTVYLQGVLDGLMFADFKVEGEPVPASISLGRIAKGVEAFYTDDRNQHVPVIFTLKLISMELSGKSKADLVCELTNLRERFHDK